MTAIANPSEHLRHTIAPPDGVHLNRRTREVEIRWPDGRTDRLSCLALRAACACSSCLHAKRSGRLALYDAEITVVEAKPFGVSGLQLFFSDGHSRGVFPWAYLRELGEAA